MPQVRRLKAARTVQSATRSRRGSSQMNSQKQNERSERRKTKLIVVPVGEGLQALNSMKKELDQMLDVLFGRVASPIDRGILTLMEVSQAYFARGQEMTMDILRQEQEGMVLPSSALSKFRKGELRHFLELTKSAIDLGSRRVTVAQQQYEERHG